MNTPQAADLFLQIFAQRLAQSDDGQLTTLMSTDWGMLWLSCCDVAQDIAQAQGLAEKATEVAARTPANWTP